MSKSLTVPTVIEMPRSLERGVCNHVLLTTPEDQSSLGAAWTEVSVSAGPGATRSDQDVAPNDAPGIRDSPPSLSERGCARVPAHCWISQHILRYSPGSVAVCVHRATTLGSCGTVFLGGQRQM